MPWTPGIPGTRERRRREGHQPRGERAGGVLERDRDGVAGLLGGVEDDARPVERRPVDAGGHVMDDPQVLETGHERLAPRRLEAHADRQQCERRTGTEELIASNDDLAGGDAGDVVLAVGEQDHGRPGGPARQVLVGLLHRSHVVRVDADRLGELGRQTRPIGGGDGPEAVGKAGDGVGAVEEPEVDAVWDVDRSRGELDDRDLGVTDDEGVRRRVDASGDPL